MDLREIKEKYPEIASLSMTKKELKEFVSTFTHDELVYYNKSLDLYYNTNDIIVNDTNFNLESKSGNRFSENIIAFSCGVCELDEFYSQECM